MFDVLFLQRFAQQWIVAQVNHTDSQIIAGAPVSIDCPQLLLIEKIWGPAGVFRGHVVLSSVVIQQPSIGRTFKSLIGVNRP
jgi:hypothetical protein